MSVSPSRGAMPTLVAFTRMSQFLTASARASLSARSVTLALQAGMRSVIFLTVSSALG